MTRTKKKLLIFTILFLVWCLPCALAPMIAISTPVTKDVVTKYVKIGCYIATLYHVYLFIECIITCIKYQKIENYKLLKILNYISYPFNILCMIMLKQYYSFMVLSLIFTFLNNYLLRKIVKEDFELKQEDPYSEFYIHRKNKNAAISAENVEKN